MQNTFKKAYEFLPKKFMTFWFHLFDLVLNRMLDF